MPIATGSSSSGRIPSAASRSTRSAGVDDSPSSHSLPPRPLLAEQRANLLDRGGDLVRREPDPLHRGAVRARAAAEVDDVAACRVVHELASAGVRLVDVGVLGELADHVAQSSVSRARVDSRCSGSTLTSASTGMKFVSPPQRGTTCSCRWPEIDPPATAPRFQPTLNPSGA